MSVILTDVPNTDKQELSRAQHRSVTGVSTLSASLIPRKPASPDYENDDMSVFSDKLMPTARGLHLIFLEFVN